MRLVIHRKVLLLIFLCFTFTTNSFANRSLNYAIEQAKKAEQDHNPKVAEIAYGKAVEICRGIDDDDQLAVLLLKYGSILSYSGKYEKAISVLVEGYEILEDKSSCSANDELKAQILTLLGMAYFYMDKWDDALHYYKKAYELAKKIHHIEGCSVLNNNIANIYQKKHDYTRALDYYKKSLALQIEEPDSSIICNTQYNIGSCYFALEEFEKADKFYLSAYEIAKSISDVEIESLCLLYLAKKEAEEKNFHKAYLQITEAEELASSLGYTLVLLKVYNVKVEILELEENYKEAYAAQKKLKHLSDSVFSEKSVRSLREFEVKYDTLEKEHRIEMQQIVINRQAIIHWTLGGLISLFIVILLLYSRLYKVQKLRNKELVLMNSERDKLFSIISHDLKNPAIALRNSLQRLIDNMDGLNKDVLLDYCEDLLYANNQQIELMHDLLNWSQLQIGKMPYRPHQFELKPIIDETIDYLDLLLKEKNIKLIQELPDELIVCADKNHIATCLRNLLTNAIKFSHKDSNIFIKVESISDEKWKMSIKDEGIGIASERIDSIFSLNSEQTKGTAGETGSGLGLIVTKELIEKNCGVIEVESELNKGCVFSFTLNKRCM